MRRPRLDRRNRIALVEQTAGAKALPEELIVQIVDRTDGVPLFVEELTKSVLESELLREEVLHHRISDVLDQRALLLPGATLDGMNIDFRHRGGLLRVDPAARSPSREWPESACAVKRRRFPVGARPTRRFAPAGSNRSSHGGNEMAEAFE
jgi:hypothetical protein